MTLSRWSEWRPLCAPEFRQIRQGGQWGPQSCCSTLYVLYSINIRHHYCTAIIRATAALCLVLFVHIVVQRFGWTQLEPRSPARGRPARPDPGIVIAELEDPHAGRPHVQPLRRPLQLVPVFYRLLGANCRNISETMQVQCSMNWVYKVYWTKYPFFLNLFTKELN